MSLDSPAISALTSTNVNGCMNTLIIRAEAAGHDEDYTNGCEFEEVGTDEAPEAPEAYQAADALDSGEVLMAQILQATDDEGPDMEDAASVEHDQLQVRLVWEILVCTHI